jgi:hypothetical protein
MSEPFRAFLVATGAAEHLTAGDDRLVLLAQRYNITVAEAQATLTQVQQQQ